MSISDVIPTTPFIHTPGKGISDPTMGGRIALAREARGLSHGQLATRLGVMAKTLKNWETDRSEPRGNKFVTLSGLLGVPVMWLMTGEETAQISAAAPCAETLTLATKMERLLSLHQQSAALILELQGDVSRLQDEIDMSELEQVI
ncbi:helix-turn-helix domain-containing protein [Sneathiella marina]|uniref:Helix-turn-helix domain-containing protein n=1 Tax=Sneathiella marina TaxID=2950108 RepID=A0ABY4W820_9PROT|nr:helix-turn-helix transcriptional regulator [Sneathiella marina]USG63172.1 helix-turn-helix domain-containing protein [Sneathiella marina]